jgi:alpha-tubulin suppressor-like RCC1 family protein
MRWRIVGTLAVFAASATAAACGSILGVDGPYHPESDAAAGEEGSAGDGTTSDAPDRDEGSPDATPGDAGDGGSPEASFADAGSVLAVSAGRYFTCARFAAGLAKCWGQNDDGEFGNGTRVGSSVPIPAMGTGIAGLFHGNGTTCAALGGAGACTGQDGDGQLFDGQLDAQSSVPVATTTLPSAPSAFAPGIHRTCAIVANGDVYCAGDGAGGELGSGATGVSATPVKVDLGGAAAKAISGTWHHVCAITTTGAVLCWGDDSAGQLGGGSFVDGGVAAPVHVTLGGAASEIGTGELFTCALVGPDSSNAVWCWGDNSYGQLGNGGGGPSAVPVRVQGLTGLANLAVGGEHVCVGKQNAGGIACWGHGSSGELGNGSNADSSTPVDVSNVGGAPSSLASGGFHTCAVIASPNVLCWGANDLGQLGNDDPAGAQQNTPIAVQF